MNQTHIHLIITHLPILGSILGAWVLAYGIWTKSDHTKTAAHSLLIVSSLGAAIAYLTGEAAEETVEKITGISKNMIDQHEDIALYALISLILTGLASIGALVFTVRKSALAKTFAPIALLLSLISFGFAARTGYLGGQIRHTEISTGGVLQGPATENGEKEKDDD